MMRQAVLLAFLGFTLTGCDFEDFAGGERSQTDFHYNFPLNPGGSVNVDTFNGSIEISGWDQNSVDISGTKYASTDQMRDAIKIDTSHSDTTVSVHAVRPYESSSISRGNMGARFVIHVPKKVNLDRIVSSNGKIEIRSVAGSATLRTSNGAIEAEQFDGPLDASTSNGHITIQEEMTARHSPVHARTSNGAISITAEHPIDSDLRASTSNGSITIHLPASTAARVRASTSNSAITTDFEVTAQGRLDKHHLEGTINGTGPDAPVIELSTSNGPIRLSKL
jgi:DUF4097 and DUF4098 domain-containing protein YvlB